MADQASKNMPTRRAPDSFLSRSGRTSHEVEDSVSLREMFEEAENRAQKFEKLHMLAHRALGMAMAMWQDPGGLARVSAGFADMDYDDSDSGDIDANTQLVILYFVNRNDNKYKNLARRSRGLSSGMFLTTANGEAQTQV